MDDNYLDKKLKGILESPPGFEPDPAAMLDMKRRLREINEPRRKRRGILWWMLLGILLLLGGGYMIDQFQQLNQQVNELSEQLIRINRQDTLFENRTIYRIDTIYQTIYRTSYVEEAVKNNAILYFKTPSSYYLNRTLPASSSGLIQNSNLGWSYRERPLSLLTKDPAGSSFLSSGIPAAASWEIPATAVAEYSGALRVVSPLSPLLLEDLSSVYASPGLELSPDYSSVKVRRHAIHPMYYFSPVGFKLGPTASPLIQFTYPLEGYGYSIGMGGELEFPQDRSLDFGIELLGVNFEVKDPTRFQDFPTPYPDDPADELHELKGNFQYVQFYAGLKQRFLPHAKLQPSLSIGVSSHRPLQQQLTYEFLSNTGEYAIRDNRKEGTPFSLNNARLGLGLSYKIGKRFRLETEGRYQHEFSLPATDYFKLQYWALHLGLNYKFSKK